MSQETRSEIISWIMFIAGAVIVALFINSFIIFNAHVPSPSMENTIMTGDRVIGLRLAYTFGAPERYDVAIFRFPDNEKEYFVKRVIGMPGEKVDIKDGKVYINDEEEPLLDHFLKETPYAGDYGPYYVPEGHYFMLGDNRNNSRDSRMWENKFVEKSKVLAKAYVTIWPNPRYLYSDMKNEKISIIK